MRLLFAIADLNDFLGAWLSWAFRLITNRLLVSIGVSSHLFETIVCRFSRQAVRCWSLIYTFLMPTSLNRKQLFLVLLLTSYVFLVLVCNCVVGWACHLGCAKCPIEAVSSLCGHVDLLYLGCLSQALVANTACRATVTCIIAKLLKRSCRDGWINRTTIWA